MFNFIFLVNALPFNNSKISSTINLQFNFSDTNATSQGTTLKWKYAEAANIGHNSFSLYAYKENVEDTMPLVEKLLFESPYYEPIY